MKENSLMRLIWANQEQSESQLGFFDSESKLCWLTCSIIDQICLYFFLFISCSARCPAPVNAHVSLVGAASHPLPHKLKTGPRILLVCQLNKHAYQEVCNYAQSGVFFFLQAAFLTRNVRIFHFLIHQLFSHLSAVIMNITIIALVRYFHIIVTSQPIYCQLFDAGVCYHGFFIAAANMRKYWSEWFTMQGHNLHTFHYSKSFRSRRCIQCQIKRGKNNTTLKAWRQ